LSELRCKIVEIKPTETSWKYEILNAKNMRIGDYVETKHKLVAHRALPYWRELQTVFDGWRAYMTTRKSHDLLKDEYDRFKRTVKDSPIKDPSFLNY